MGEMAKASMKSVIGQDIVVGNLTMKYSKSTVYTSSPAMEPTMDPTFQSTSVGSTAIIVNVATLSSSEGDPFDANEKFENAHPISVFIDKYWPVVVIVLAALVLMNVVYLSVRCLQSRSKHADTVRQLEGVSSSSVTVTRTTTDQEICGSSTIA